MDQGRNGIAKNLEGDSRFFLPQDLVEYLSAQVMERVPMKNIPAKSLLDEGVTHAGFVVKEGGRLRSMQTRYFILREGCLYYYKDFKSTKEQNAFCIIGYEVKEDLSDDNVFGIRLKPEKAGKKPFYFVVPSDEERKVWVEKLTREMGRIAGDGCESGEPYDYCYQRTVHPLEEQHNYEKTDDIEIMQTPRQGVPNTYTQQGPEVRNSRETPKATSPPPTSPPPSLPNRSVQGPTRMLPNKGRGLTKTNSPFMPKVQKRFAPQPPEGSMPPYPDPNSKPKPPISQKPLVSQKPSTGPYVSQKPSIPRIPMGAPSNDLSEDIYAKKKEAVMTLAKQLKQRDPKLPGRYEVQHLNNNLDKDAEDSDDSSTDSESYLPMVNEPTSMLTRGAPSGCSMKKGYEIPRELSSEDSDEKLLPLSVYQDSLTRDTAECILTSIGRQGMYLIRPGRTGLQVITVFVNDACRHYQVFEKNDLKYLKDGEPCFTTLADLVRHYLRNNLPTCSSRLEVPYS